MLGFLAILPVFALFIFYCRWRKKNKEVERDRGKDDVMQKNEGVGKHDNDKTSNLC